MTPPGAAAKGHLWHKPLKINPLSVVGSVSKGQKNTADVVGKDFGEPKTVADGGGKHFGAPKTAADAVGCLPEVS